MGLEDFVETLPFLSLAIRVARRMSASDYSKAHVRIVSDLIAEDRQAVKAVEWREALARVAGVVETREESGVGLSEAVKAASNEIWVFNRIPKDEAFVSPVIFEMAAREVVEKGGNSARGRVLAAAARGYVFFDAGKTMETATSWYLTLAIGAVLFALGHDPMFPPVLAAGAVGLGVVLFAAGQWLYSPAALRRGLAQRKARLRGAV